MSTVLMFALSIVLLSCAVVALALRQEYLVVLSWSRVGTIFLERDDNARYHRISRWELPLAVLRFAGVSLSVAIGAGRRAAARVGDHLPSLVSSKV